MPLVSMRQILDEAAKGGYGIGAFNVNNMEQIQAIMEAASETGFPVIIQASRGARKYTNDRFLHHLMIAATEIYPEVIVALHQDHGNSPDTCRSAIEMGFTSVMMDGSLMEDGQTPSDFEYNVEVTRETVKMAHACGVTVEGELGCLGSLESRVCNGEDDHGATGKLSYHQLLTAPDQAVEFVTRTGIDALAVAIGTSHGAYKFSRQPDGDVLAMDRIIKIHNRLPDTHLVMHGASSVPKELQDLLNNHGGQIRSPWGVPIEEIQLGIKNGVRKINVDTDTRMAMTGAVRQFLDENPTEFDPRGYLTPARDAMKKVIRSRMLAFGQVGIRTDYVPIPLSIMAQRYTEESLCGTRLSTG